MSVTIYASEILPGSDTPLHFANSIEEAEREAVEVFRDIQAESGQAELPPLNVYAFDMNTPKLDDILNVLNERSELKDCILRNRRVVKTVIV
ncbi:hypothetical protein FY140_17640 [Agrobacterium tumefaciens]|uniref:hypothetical protein n=1 Tax=Agrobacterium tumefaciens TaxID=358 RepID=UPI0021D14BD1|nr:hypothetical protein [Agrobacterium tumefaciens]UXT22540.1 hypothetical protein FY140_17640 [Agrobacterium tumefaciens]